MNTATITDIAWEGAKVAFRLIMAARSRKDAEAIIHQLRALGVELPGVARVLAAVGGAL